MAKEFSVELGGRTRKLAYRGSDAIALKNRFNKPIARLLREDVMGFRDEPNPEKPGTMHAVMTPDSDLEVQVAFLATGIRRALVIAGDSKANQITDERVQGWVDEHLAQPDAVLGVLVGPVWRAFLYSGALGYSKDVSLDVDAEGDGDAGKEKAPEIPAAVRAAE
jgi:hypothetical protein